jgi:hypothetical protein
MGVEPWEDWAMLIGIEWVIVGGDGLSRSLVRVFSLMELDGGLWWLRTDEHGTVRNVMMLIDWRS